jgi:hypothetical protein
MNNICSALKKNNGEKCKNKCKNELVFCGIHLKKKKNQDYNFVYSIDYFNNNLLQNRFTLKNLKLTIKHLKLEKIIKLTQKKKILYNEIKRYYNNVKNVNKIILIQKIFRGFKNRVMYGKGLLYRNKCINTEDFLTLINLKEIPIKYFFSFTDINNFIYGFDIRSLNKLLENDNKNPYNREIFSNYVLRYINIRLKHINISNISIEIEQIDLTSQQSQRNKIITIFQKFDLLGNYTDSIWFENLSFDQLKDLYFIAEDIWNYRAELDIETKKKILIDGIAFRISYNYIKNLSNNEFNKNKLQNIVLDEFNRFLTEGITESDKVLGSLLMLTALVEVSPNAANSLPHLIQQ